MIPRVGCHRKCIGIRAVGSVTNPEPGFRSDIIGSLDPIGSDGMGYRIHAPGLLRHIGRDMDEAIKGYQTFLRVAPTDRRKVPEAYYEMAICYFNGYPPDVVIDSVKKLYKEGKEAEKLQLPCFLPYKAHS